jgi:hypothetical protein
MFTIVGFLTWHILGVVGSQIETYIYMARILTNLKRCCLKTEKFREVDICQQKIT